MRTIYTATTLATLIAASADATDTPSNPCDRLQGLRLPDTAITTIESVKDPVQHCKPTGPPT